MAAMDAQEITFNQDPEAQAVDIEQIENTDSGCCKRIFCRSDLFYWYIAPLTYEFCHTLKCFLFHPINFAITIFLFIWDCTMLSLGIGFIALCCIGIPLLWISMESIIAFSRIDLGFNYYMAENVKKIDKSREYLLKLSLYFTDIPLCCCYNQGDNDEKCFQLMFKRMKYLFSNIEIYKYILYHILIGPIVTFSTWWIVIVIGVNMMIIGFPIWYLADDTLFVKGEMFLAWSSECVNPKGSGISCDKDYIWIINTFGRAMGAAIILLLILPLTMRLNNWFAYLNKIVAYRFYTFYFTKDIRKMKDMVPILSSDNVSDSV